MNKNGITMVSIVMYVVIFFALTAIATGVTIAMNSNSLKDKGKIYVQEAEIKLKNNLLNSFENSDSITTISNKLIFSNNDEYYYEPENKIIYKNGGILIQNVEEMTFYLGNNKGLVSLDLNAKVIKYNQEKNINFITCKGDV